MEIIKGKVTIENFHKICKVCLEESSSNLNLSSSIEFQTSLTSSFLSLDEVLSKVSSELDIKSALVPTLICQNCLEQLTAAYIFQLKCREAAEILNDFNTDVIIIKSEETTDNVSDNSFDKRANSVINSLVRKKREAVHVCPICIKEFSALDLREHIYSHKAFKKYLQIPQVEKVSPSTRFYTVRKSQKTIVEKTQLLHKCPYCNIEFPIKNFRIHIATHQTDSEFKCDQCERVFRRLSHLNIHKIKHLKEHTYKCEFCGKGFVIKKNYECHILIHTKEKLPHKCSFCMKRFSNPQHLIRHRLIHTENVTYGEKYKVYRCQHCRKSFKDTKDLKNHNCKPINYRKSPSQLFCRLCEKKYKNAREFSTHNKLVHLKESPRSLCSICGMSVRNLSYHMIKHSGEKNFDCHLCSKKFRHKSTLEQHLLVHSGQKPFICQTCGKAFNNRYNFTVHQRIHSGIKRHVCHICSKGFLEKSYLRKHLLVH